MPVVDSFKYLGSSLARNCSDSREVEGRVESACKAFGSLHRSLFASKHISPRANRAAYTTVILSIRIYGCECLSLAEAL